MQSGSATDGTRYDVRNGPGRAVVLVHGLGLNRQMWQWQTDALAEHFKVITYDLTGHGESPAPSEMPSLTMFSRQLSRLLDDLEISEAAVVGFSLGGMIARRFAMDHAPRLWALAVLHSAHRRDRAAHDAIQARVHQARDDGPGATVDAALERWFTERFRQDNPAVMDQVRNWVLANSKEIYPDIYQVLVDGVDELVAPVPPIDCPALVMTGDEDYGNSVEMARAIAGEISGARTVTLPGLRHMAMVEDPAPYNAELITFLTFVQEQVA